MLRRLFVHNFRCFENFECRFDRRHLLLGGNGSGKSSLLEALTFLRDFCVQGETPPGEWIERSRTRWSDQQDQSFELDVAGNGGVYQFKLRIDLWGSPSRLRVREETVDFNGVPIFRFREGEINLYNDGLTGRPPVTYPFDWHRSGLATIAERRDNTILSWFKRWLSSVAVVSPDPRRMDGIASTEVRRPDRDLSNFADWYRHLRQEREDYRYLEDLRLAINGLEGIRLEEAGERRRELKFKFKGIRQEFRLGELSDGQRVLAGLYATVHFAMDQGSLLCFDEFDNYVALHEILPLLDRMAEHAEGSDESKATQLLIVSHHPELLNRMAFREGLRLDRPDGRQVRVRAFVDPGDTGLPASELVARGWEHE